MTRPSLHPRLGVLALGLALGGACLWLARIRAPASPAETPAAVPAAPPSSRSWRASLRLPLLAPDAIAPTVDAWLAFRAPDGTPPAYAARADTLRALLVRLPAEALPRLLDPLAALPTPADRQLLAIALTAWTELDAPAAARWAASQGDAPDRTKLIRTAALAWAALDPAAAATWACALPDADLARQAARVVLPILASQDPALAYALASSLDSRFLHPVLNELMEALAATDPAAALRTFGSGRFEKSIGGYWAVKGALIPWIKQDPAAALVWLASETETNDQAWFETLDNLVRGNPGLAPSLLAALRAQPGLARNQASMAKLFSAWGAHDADAALRWLATIEDPVLRMKMLEEASHGPDLEHPEKSLPFALALPDSSDRDFRLSQLLGDWATRNPSAALAWIRQHDDPAVAAASVEAQAAILANIARAEPATAAAEWQALTDPKTRIAARQSIAEAWGQTDPAAALHWMVAQNPALGFQPYAGDTRLLYAWSLKDPVAALRWAEAVPNAEFRANYLDALAGDAVTDLAQRAATAALYAQLRDLALRAEFVSKHVRKWLGKDPAAAKTWLETHDALSPEQTAAFFAQP